MSAAAEPYVLHLRAPLGSFFITSMLLSPRSKWPPMLHELNGNTIPFGPKLSKYGPRPIWSRLPTPWGLAQITVHHFPNSVSGSSIIGAQQTPITVLLIFSLSAVPFQTTQVFVNGKCYYQWYILCKMLPRTRPPLSLLTMHRECCFVSRRINSFLALYAFIMWPQYQAYHFLNHCWKPSLCYLSAPHPPPPVICVSLVIIIAYWKRCGWLRTLPLG